MAMRHRMVVGGCRRPASRAATVVAPTGAAVARHCGSGAPTGPARGGATVSPRVRRLYCEFMVLSPEFPPTATFRARVQRGFLEHRECAVTSAEFKRALSRGRYLLRYLHELLQVKRYRAMNKRYSWAALHLPADGAAGALASAVGLHNRATFGFSAPDGTGDDDTAVTASGAAATTPQDAVAGAAHATPVSPSRGE